MRIYCYIPEALKKCSMLLYALAGMGLMEGWKIDHVRVNDTTSFTVTAVPS
jgi:hypothetical protein